ncbi:MAG: hypothetical protein N2A99_01000 [Carnobacterium alterfunditum]
MNVKTIKNEIYGPEDKILLIWSEKSSAMTIRKTIPSNAAP